MEFLSSPRGQALYAGKNGEYPVSVGLGLGQNLKIHNPLLESWGPFLQDIESLAVIASRRANAIRIADQVGYDY